MGFKLESRLVEALMEELAANGVRVLPLPLPIRLPDADDQPSLEVAAAAGQDAVLITGNMHHFPDHLRYGVSVFTPRQWVDRWRSADQPAGSESGGPGAEAGPLAPSRGPDLLPDGRQVDIDRRDLMEDVGLHTFRHTHASLLIAAGVDVKAIQRRLGHERVTVTLQTYGHLLPGQDEKAAAAMDRFSSSL